MKKLLILAALAALCMPAVRAQQTPAAPLRVIFDTDMGNDVDDPLALDMLYKAVDRGESPARHSQQQGTEFSPRYIDMMNTWYGYPEIPVGRVRDGVCSNATTTHAPSASRDFSPAAAGTGTTAIP